MILGHGLPNSEALPLPPSPHELPIPGIHPVAVANVLGEGAGCWAAGDMVKNAGRRVKRRPSFLPLGCGGSAKVPRNTMLPTATAMATHQPSKYTPRTVWIGSRAVLYSPHRGCILSPGSLAP
ncbi:hypothetical protein ACJQWK_01976 [Exserohilum turcicum]